MAKPSALTDFAIRNLRPTAERYEIWDSKVTGLGVRVSQTGTKTFVVLYRHRGHPKRLTLGRYPVLRLEDARRLANEALRSVAHGSDPQADKTAARDATTFQQALDQFIRLRCKRHNKPSTAKNTEDTLRSGFGKKWANRDMRDISKADVIKVIDGYSERELHGAANHALTAVKTFFNWCVARGIITANPAVTIPRPSPAGQRDRVLTPGELKAVWTAAQNCGFPYGSIIQLLILTGQRRGEVTGMRKAEVDLKKKLWVLPPERTKNSREHALPLGKLTIEVIKAIPNLNDTYMFPARGNDNASFSGFSKLKSQIDEDSKVSGWTLHDLRRTAATHMAALGIAPHVVERLLNHTSGTFAGVAGIYNRFQYLPEMQDALGKWEAFLIELIGPDLEHPVNPALRQTVTHAP